MTIAAIVEPQVEKIMRLTFPILNTRLPGTVRSEIVLPAIANLAAITDITPLPSPINLAISLWLWVSV